MILFKNIKTSSQICFLQCCKRFLPQSSFHLCASNKQLSQTDLENIDEPDEEKTFRVLEIVKKKFVKQTKRELFTKIFKQPRENRQPIDQDWGNVWPTARSFHPASVPIPVRMGMPYKSKAAPSKYGNLELMKIPNFLHLTPPVVARQCEVLKKFCTKWPENLETEEEQDFHFPITISKSSYLHSGPSIRDPRSRIVSLKISVDSLQLDEHALDKLLRLVKERFDPKTRYLTITADRCPLSSQNEEYCHYLLSVLYNEALKTEPWEHEKTVEDMSYFKWEGSPSQLSMNTLEKSTGEKYSEEVVKDYSESVLYIHNEKETMESVDSYKKAVLKLLNLL